LPETLTGLEVVLGAVATLQIAGALRAVLDLTVRYAHERHQFGKAIAEFQMVKSHLAELAGEVMAAEAAADAVPRLLADPLHHEIALRSARVRSAQSAGAAARIAHQVHGTIGVTAEYPLHVFTRQLWLWRDFDVTEGASQESLGLALAHRGQQDLWRLLVDGPGPSADHEEGGEDHG
jgi:acyl-CoA dehydrogenase